MGVMAVDTPPAVQRGSAAAPAAGSEIHASLWHFHLQLGSHGAMQEAFLTCLSQRDTETATSEHRLKQES